MTKRAHFRSSRRRGSALITSILVILVLTIIGIGVAYFTQVEDRISGNDRLMKAGFYIAEAGLRVGEEAVSNAITNSITGTNLLNPPTTPPTGYTGSYPRTMTPPGTGNPYTTAVILNVSIPTLSFSREYGGIQVPVPTGVLVRDQGVYSLYVRNNAEEPSGSPTTDNDRKINLISVGQVTLPGGGGITKILEEQLVLTTQGTASGTQKQADAGGTGSGLTKAGN